MDVSNVLKKSFNDPTNIEKPIPVTIDLQCLVAFDLNLKSETFQETKKTCQLMINSLFKQDIHSNEAGTFCVIPRSVKNLLPRQKPIPTEKHKTRWERFAEKKGIKKRKKKRVEFNEEFQDYRPVYGYKNQGKPKDLSDWLHEVDEKGTDKFEEDKKGFNELMQKRKKELKRIKCNKRGIERKQRLKQRRSIIKYFVNNKDFKNSLKKKILDSKQSTASFGRFDEKLDNDNVKVRRGKQKYDPLIKGDSEKSENLKILEKITSGGNILNKRRAINTLRKK
jgi:regulator of ribosome biosynthesis